MMFKTSFVENNMNKERGMSRLFGIALIQTRKRHEDVFKSLT